MEIFTIFIFFSFRRNFFCNLFYFFAEYEKLSIFLSSDIFRLSHTFSPPSAITNWIFFSLISWQTLFIDSKNFFFSTRLDLLVQLFWRSRFYFNYSLRIQRMCHSRVFPIFLLLHVVRNSFFPFLSLHRQPRGFCDTIFKWLLFVFLSAVSHHRRHFWNGSPDDECTVTTKL